jgi:hypothetical protein
MPEPYIGKDSGVAPVLAGLYDEAPGVQTGTAGFFRNKIPPFIPLTTTCRFQGFMQELQWF